MLITRIELENIKSYRQVSIDFRRGTTAISGANGAGKTTLVEAIGFALFGYLPYSHDQFVREGEKQGRVIIHLIGSDTRHYTVERRCGSGPRWLVYDVEADSRLEQRTDVVDKLHDLFGIDRERPLDSLFRDALGVPQGTFTAIFLEPASKRKQTFDALLQIEDYKTAFDNLLDTARYYREQMTIQQVKIDHLTKETAELETFRTQLKEARELDGQQKNQLAQQTQLLNQRKEHKEILDTQATHVQDLTNRHAHAQATHQHAQQMLLNIEQQLQGARHAQQVITQTSEEFRRYQQAQETLKGLRQQAQHRDNLRQELSRVINTQTQINGNMQNIHERLAEIATAYQKIVELAPLVEQQADLEKKYEEARQEASLYISLVEEGKRVRSRYDSFQQQQTEFQQHVTEIEPLVPLANQLDERLNILNQLRLRSGERMNKQHQLQERQESLREKLTQQSQDSERLRYYEQQIAHAERHRKQAEELSPLQDQYDQLTAQLHHLEGNIEGYVKSRAQSAGGQCPLLNESCLNIRKHGIASLESYFDSLLTEEHANAERIQQQQEHVLQRLNKVKPYADEMNKLSQYIEQRDHYARLLQSLAKEITRLERDVASLTEELESLKTIDMQVTQATNAYNESKAADTKVRQLPTYNEQIQHLQIQIQQLETELKERRQEALKYRNSESQAQQFQSQIKNLNDPRGQSKGYQRTIASEEHYQQQLQDEQQRQYEVQQKILSLEEQLQAYVTLDADIKQQETLIQQSAEGYQRYLGNIREAQTLPEREQAYQQQQEVTHEALQQFQQLEQTLQQAQAAFDQHEMDNLKQEIEHLNTALTRLTNDIQYHQIYMKNLEQKITASEALLVELDATRQEYQTLADLQNMTDYFRKLIKDAAPHVLKAMLTDISAEANRIFGQIMGDRSAQLSWRNNYEIILRRQGVDRSFAQLSGGEQMSAALAVRLALLKKLSTLNIAFFDEPTQNMDELRRMNLAEQIRRVRGFDQLIVISHDDTFEQSLDSLVRLNKVNGETHILSDEDAPLSSEIRQLNSEGDSSMLLSANS